MGRRLSIGVLLAGVVVGLLAAIASGSPVTRRTASGAATATGPIALVQASSAVEAASPPASQPTSTATIPPSTPDEAPSAPPATAAARLRVDLEAAVSPRPRSVAERSWEPVVATHPTDPRRIAVVYLKRGGSGSACATNPTVRISHDGGRTWRTTRSSPGRMTSRGMGLHAALAWGPGPRGGARLYWADMTSAGCGGGPYSLTTSSSDDEGDTWSQPRVERHTPAWVGGFPDIAVDRDPRSPNRGVVYVAYNWPGSTGHGPGFRILASADFGRTWRPAEVPAVRLAPRARDQWRIAYRLRPAPDGSVYAAWYQVDMRHRDPSNVFAKGGLANVERLGVAVARVRFDRVRGTFLVGRPRIAVRVRETAWTAANLAATGTDGRIRPDPIWQFGFDVDPDGRPFVAVAGYGAGRSDPPRGTVTVARSNDGGATWVSRVLRSVPAQRGVRQSSLRPSVVASRDFILVTLRTLDDRARDATMGVAATISTDGGRTWQRPIAVSPVRWHPSDLGDATNGMGLRERAERAADGSVIWAFGDGRLAAGHIGRTAVFTVRLHIERS